MQDIVIETCIAHDLTIREFFAKAHEGNIVETNDAFNTYITTGEISPEGLRYGAQFIDLRQMTLDLKEGEYVA